MLKSFIKTIKRILGIQNKIIEYNIPIEELEPKYYDIIHADISFTKNERKQILLAVLDWNIFLNKYITIDVKFDYYEGNENIPIDRVVLHRADNHTSIISDYEKNYKVSVLGFCSFTTWTIVDLYLTHNRLLNDFQWRTVTAHEIGHMLGLGHIQGPAIMQDTCKNDPAGMTELDAIEFARVFDIYHNQLKYVL